MHNTKPLYKTLMTLITLSVCCSMTLAKEPKSTSKKSVQAIEAKTSSPKASVPPTTKAETKPEPAPTEVAPKTLKGYYEHKGYTLHVWDNQFSKDDSGGLQKILISLQVDRSISQDGICYFITSTDELSNPQRVTITDHEKNSCHLEIDINTKGAKIKAEGEDCIKLCKNPKTFTDIPVLSPSPDN